jgi:membrane protein DedA with SNARE-associated domain
MNVLLSWIVTAIASLGYPGIAGLMAIESACIPLPSEIIMPFAGYLVSQGQLNLLLAATAGAVGCNFGSTIAYGVGRCGGRAFVLRWGWYLLFDARELDRMDHFFVRFGVAAVLVGRLLPIVRTFISLPAGISRMGFARFQIYTFIGSWPWCFALAYIGMLLGKEWHSNPTMQKAFQQFDWLIAGLLTLAFGFYLYRRWRMTP